MFENRAPVSGADLLKRIRPSLAEESTEICLRPDLVEQWSALNEELQAAVAMAGTVSTAGKQGSRPGTQPKGHAELAERVQALEEEIQRHSVVFRFRALTKDAWRALCDDHPPRKDNQVDQYTGYDRDAVLDEAVRESLIDPVFDAASWSEFLEVISAGEWDELRRVTNSVNKGVVEPPKSVLASRILARPNSGSAPRKPGA